ncbi:MAG: hypothetical protein FWG31_02285 [Oscillospiraceae bacterium]|nr:hypothetical protein [Oscillospiraceae bacterium]
MKTKILSIMLVLSILFPLCGSANVIASDADDKVSEVVAFSFNISAEVDFDIGEYEDMIPILEDNGIIIGDILAIHTFGDNSSQAKSNEEISRANLQIPGGVIVLTGQYISSNVWQISVVNVGLLPLYDVEAEVTLHRNNIPYGPVLYSKRGLGDFGIGRMTTETYTNNLSVDYAMVTVKGRTSQWEYFTLNGIHVR